MKNFILALVFMTSTQTFAQEYLYSVGLQMAAASNYVAYYFSDMGNISVQRLVRKGTNNNGRKILVKYKRGAGGDPGVPYVEYDCTLELRVSYDLQTVTNLRDVCN